MSEAAEKEKSPAPVSKLGRGLGRLIPVKAAPAANPASATPAAVAATVATTPSKPNSPPSQVSDGISTTPKATTSPQAESTGKRVQEIEISKIRPNARQPRRDFDAASISELAGSIRSAGLLQPVILRPITGSRDQFELIAGERRLRACKSLDWTKIPAIVTNATEEFVITAFAQ